MHSASLAASLAINENRSLLADALAEGDSALHVEDARDHFAFLAQALEFGRHDLFTAYTHWCKPTFAHRGVTAGAFSRRVERMADVLAAALPPAESEAAVACVREAHGQLDSAPESLDATLGKIPSAAQEYLDRMLALDDAGARHLAIGHLRTGGGVRELYTDVLAPAMHEVGRLWQANRIDIAREHYCAGVTQGVLGAAAAFIPTIRAGRTAVVGCVTGENHSVGSRMVADSLELAGWRAYWLGASVPGSDLLRMVVDTQADLLAISCTHAPCLHDLASLLTAVRVLPETKHVKVLVGGHAFGWCDNLWRDVGADAHARDASSAVLAAHDLLRATPATRS